MYMKQLTYNVAYYNGKGAILEDVSPYKSFFTKLFPKLIIIETFENLSRFNLLIVPDGEASHMCYYMGQVGKKELKLFLKRGGKFIGILEGAAILSKKMNFSISLTNSIITYENRFKNSLGIINSVSNKLFFKIVDGKPIATSSPIMSFDKEFDDSFNHVLGKVSIPFDETLRNKYDENFKPYTIILDDKKTKSMYLSGHTIDQDLKGIWYIHNTWAGYPVIIEKGNILLFFTNLLESKDYFETLIVNFIKII